MAGQHQRLDTVEGKIKTRKALKDVAGQHQRLDTVEGKRRRGRPRKIWLDNIKDLDTVEGKRRRGRSVKMCLETSKGGDGRPLSTSSTQLRTGTDDEGWWLECRFLHPNNRLIQSFKGWMKGDSYLSSAMFLTMFQAASQMLRVS